MRRNADNLNKVLKYRIGAPTLKKFLVRSTVRKSPVPAGQQVSSNGCHIRPNPGQIQEAVSTCRRTAKYPGAISLQWRRPQVWLRLLRMESQAYAEKIRQLTFASGGARRSPSGKRQPSKLRLVPSSIIRPTWIALVNRKDGS
jgi:hypothetical protein